MYCTIYQLLTGALESGHPVTRQGSGKSSLGRLEGYFRSAGKHLY